MTYGPSGDRYAPPARSSGLQSALWMLAALIVVVACGVTIAVVLSGNSGSPRAGGSTPPQSSPVSSSSISTSDGSPTPTPTPSLTAPTTDVLPSNAQSGACGVNVSPNLVAVEVVTVLGIVQNNSPDATTGDILRDCASAAVRSRVPELYGLSFGVDYSADLTGGSDKGVTARYSVNVVGGSGKLTLTLTRQRDGHYEVTDFTYG